MSELVFPDLPGLDFGATKTPVFKNSIFEAISGKEARAKLMQYPKWKFKLSFEFLLQNLDETQLTDLMGFLCQMAGSYDTFLYNDPTDNYFTRNYVGDGSTTDFDIVMVHRVGSFVEPIAGNNRNTSADTLVKVAGIEKVLGVDWHLTGSTVVFTVPPADGDIIQIAGQFYYRCRFVEDSHDFTELLDGWHECTDLEFIGSLGGLI